MSKNLAAALFGLALTGGGCEAQPPRNTVRRDPAVDAIALQIIHDQAEDSERTKKAVKDVMDRIKEQPSIEYPAISEVTDDAEMTSEQKEVIQLMRQLRASTTVKYAETDFGANTKRVHIITPSGKKLAVSIQDGGSLININPDDRFHTTGPTTNNAPFQLVLEEGGPNEMSPFMNRDSFNSYSEYFKKNDPMAYKEWTKYTNAMDAVFTGRGAQLYFGMNDCGAVFHAFGLTDATLPSEKARIILQTLNNQL